MRAFHFYHVSEKYIRFLSSGDSKVQYNKKQSRPYVGIVLEIHNINYYVPLESPKPNHVNLRNSGPILKLKGGTYGIMGFNNMIPIPESALVDFDFSDIENEAYKLLLMNQLRYCNQNRELILNRARDTYRKAVRGNIDYYNRVCCDFKKLERMAISYNPNHQPQKK